MFHSCYYTRGYIYILNFIQYYTNYPIGSTHKPALNFHFTPLLFQSRTNHQIQFSSIFFKITRKNSKMLRWLCSVRPLFTIQTPVFKNVCIPGINQIYGLNPWYYGILPNPLFWWKKQISWITKKLSFFIIQNTPEHL